MHILASLDIHGSAQNRLCIEERKNETNICLQLSDKYLLTFGNEKKINVT